MDMICLVRKDRKKSVYDESKSEWGMHSVDDFVVCFDD